MPCVKRMSFALCATVMAANAKEAFADLSDGLVAIYSTAMPITKAGMGITERYTALYLTGNVERSATSLTLT